MIIRDIMLIFLSWLLGVMMAFMYFIHVDEKDKEHKQGE